MIDQVDPIDAELANLAAAEPTPVVVAEFTGANNYSYGLLAVDGKLLFLQRSASQADSLYLSDGTVGRVHA